MIVRDQRTPDDDAVVDRVITAGFGDDGLVANLAAALRARPDLGAALVAEADGDIVGQVQLTVSWVDSPERLVQVLVLSPIAVVPERQCQGVGTALVAAARERAIELGAPLLFLEGDPAYYSRHGFVAASGLGFVRPSVRIPDVACQVMTLPAWTGETGALVYNDTFWTFDAVGLR